MASYQALYRTHRPLTFDTVIGQEHVTRTLKNEIRNDRIAHAYLFCGSRGTGKTSTARIFSRAVNCQSPIDGNPCNLCDSCKGILDGSILDVTEIDAASNNGVDNIRSIREEAQYSASVTRYKIYIIDEVHMLSGGAFNALLKLLEEPPEHVIFILATTESQKVPATILSRCQRFDFKRITVNDIILHLAEVCEKSGVRADKNALGVIARAADGAMRDALSILDQCLSVGAEEITYDEVAAFLGATDNRFLTGILRAVSEEDSASALSLIDEFMAAGKNPLILMENLVETLRSLLLCKMMPEPDKALDTSPEYAAELKELSLHFSDEAILFGMKLLSECMLSSKSMKNPRVLLEMAVTKMCIPAFSQDTDALLARLGELERKVANGVSVKASASPTPKKEEKVIAPKAEEKVTPPPKEVVKKEEPSERFLKIKNAWQEILDRAASDMMLGFALMNATPSDVGGHLALVYKDGEGAIYKETASSKRAEIEQIIEEVTGLKEAVYFENESNIKKETKETDHLAELLSGGNPIIVE